MPDVKREIRLVTEQKINPNKPQIEEGYPLRDWNIEVFLVHATDGSLVPANVYEKATYKLHETFGKKATQVFKHPPFRISEEGWGEFDMRIVLSVLNKGGDHEISHDLNFGNERYEAQHKVTFRNPKPELLALLKESGPVPGDDPNGLRAGAVANKDALKKKSRKSGNVDMERLAEGLQKLTEDDLLNVVQMVHDNKTAETYTKNDVENGEFHVDLYTLPDGLVKMLWDFTASKTEL